MGSAPIAKTMIEDGHGVALPGPFAGADTALDLLARIEFPSERLEGPRLGAAATWIDRIGPALARSGLTPADHKGAFLRVTAFYEREGGGVPPEATRSDYDPRLIAILRAALDGSGWNDAISDIEVREEWHASCDCGLSIALYARRDG